MKKRMPWLRLYTEVLDDPKVQRLPPHLFKTWVNLLCLAGERNGALPSVDDVAFRLRMSAHDASSHLDDLTLAGLVDTEMRTGERKIHAWGTQQYQGDGSTERVQKYRAKRRDAGLKVFSDYSRFRSALVERDGCQCVYCEATDRKLVVDHMVPIASGGTDDIDNLALACKECNSGKAGRTPEQAKMAIAVKSAFYALARYRERSVTVTETAPEQSRAEPDPETESETEPERTQPETPPASEVKTNLKMVLGGRGGVVSAEARRKVCAALAIGDAEPLVRVYEAWSGSRTAVDPDALFVSQAPKFYDNAGPRVREACMPLSHVRPEIAPVTVRASSSLLATLRPKRRADA